MDLRRLGALKALAAGGWGDGVGRRQPRKKKLLRQFLSYLFHLRRVSLLAAEHSGDLGHPRAITWHA
jgi:hypothetical protein